MHRLFRDHSTHGLARCTVLLVCISMGGCSLEGLSSEAFAPHGPLSIISTQTTEHAYVGETFGLQMIARGGSPPYRWDAEGLPSGVSLDPLTGSISGAPAEESALAPKVRVRDADGRRKTHSLRLNVWARPEIDTGWLPSGVLNEAGEWSLTSSGGRAPLRWALAGLPSGLSYDPDSGVFSGSPLVRGDHHIMARVTDANGVSTHKTLVLRVSSPRRTLMPSVKLVGEATQDLAGFSVAGVGDVNNDGHSDVLIGAVGRMREVNDAPTSARGSAYLAYGPVNANVKLLDNTVKLLGEAHGDNAGFAVSGGGDINGDGDPDLLIGAPNKSAGASHSGMAYILNGPIGRSSNLLEADAQLRGEHEADHAGTALTIVGDMNGDGLDDVVIGSPGSDRGGIDSGAAYIFYGPVTGVLHLSSADVILVGETPGQRLGVSVAPAGDVNGDSLADLIIGTHEATLSGLTRSVASYILCGRDSDHHGGPLSGIISIGDAETVVLRESSLGAQAYRVEGAGDINGDGFDDIIIGGAVARHGDHKIFGASLFYGPLDESLKLGDAEATFMASGSTQRISVSGAGDVNGDGYGDLVIGNPFEDHEAQDVGAAYIIHGPLLGVWRLEEAAAAIFYGRDAMDHAGFSVARAGDLNDDGFDDVIIGSPQFWGPGAVYLLYGSR